MSIGDFSSSSGSLDPSRAESLESSLEETSESSSSTSELRYVQLRGRSQSIATAPNFKPMSDGSGTADLSRLRPSTSEASSSTFDAPKSSAEPSPSRARSQSLSSFSGRPDKKKGTKTRLKGLFKPSKSKSKRSNLEAPQIARVALKDKLASVESTEEKIRLTMQEIERLNNLDSMTDSEKKDLKDYEKSLLDLQEVEDFEKLTAAFDHNPKTQSLDEKIAIEMLKQLRDRIIELSTRYQSADDKVELGRCQAFKEFAMEDINAVVNQISKNMDNELFKGLGALGFLSYLRMAHIDMEDSPDLSKLRLSDPELVALHGYSEVDYTGINTASREAAKLDDATLSELRSHATSHFNRAINSAPAAKNKESVVWTQASVMAYLQHLLEGMKKLPRVSGLIQRSILNEFPGMRDAFKVGKVLTDHGFTSGTTNEEPPGGCLIMKIEPADGEELVGFYDFPFSAHKGENEVLSLPGTQYEILQDKDHSRRIILKQLPPDQQSTVSIIEKLVYGDK